jgi:hypothetical protein
MAPGGTVSNETMVSMNTASLKMIITIPDTKLPIPLNLCPLFDQRNNDPAGNNAKNTKG